MGAWERAVSVNVTAKTDIWYISFSLHMFKLLGREFGSMFLYFDDHKYYINERRLFHVYFITINRICTNLALSFGPGDLRFGHFY